VRGALTATTALLVLGGSLLTGAGSASAETCLTGAVETRYAQLGGTTGRLGAVTGCEQSTADGRFATFQRGAVYWSAASGAWDVSGSFRDLWAGTGWENGFLRYPVSGEVGIRAGGVFQNYQGGTLYWSPASAAHSVSGSFLGLYAATGYENGCLGYPLTQELPSRDAGVYQRFQGGVAYWSPTTGAHALCGAFLDAYASTGYENGSLGYPVSDEHDVPGGRRVDFQRGYVEWSAATGARVNRPIAAVVPVPAPPTTTPPPPPNVYYANCAEARAAGAAPIRAGQPGYRSGLDRDGDGTACDA
jgi:uncharacterized protein with LGFP repeats